MTDNSDTITTGTETTKDALTNKPRKGFFSRFRRRKVLIASNHSVETNDYEKEEETERTISEAETTDSVITIPMKQEDVNLVRVETETTVSDTPENDSVASSSSSLVSSCSASSFFPASMDEHLGPSYKIHSDNYLHKCLNLLSSDDLDLNRLGLQKLNLLVSGRMVLDMYRSEEIASSVLVLGGPMGSMEELLRFVFVTMICDNPQNHCDHASPKIQESLLNEVEAIEEWVLSYNPSNSDDDDDGNEDEDEKSESKHVNFNDNDELNNSTHHTGYASQYDNSEEASAPHSQGKAGGVLHNHALKILANALGAVYVEDPAVMEDIPLDCSLWKSIIMSLSQNIESNHSAKATVYSMKILRFLYFVQPGMILPLLKYSLFANLVEIKDYGEEHGLPMISEEAEKLLMHARGKPSARRRSAKS